MLVDQSVVSRQALVDQAAASPIFTSGIDKAVVLCGHRRCSKWASGGINQTMCLSSRHWCHQSASGVIRQPVASSSSQWRHQAASGVIKQQVVSWSPKRRYECARCVVGESVALWTGQWRLGGGSGAIEEMLNHLQSECGSGVGFLILFWSRTVWIWKLRCFVVWTNREWTNQLCLGVFNIKSTLSQ